MALEKMMSKSITWSYPTQCFSFSFVSAVYQNRIILQWTYHQDKVLLRGEKIAVFANSRANLAVPTLNYTGEYLALNKSLKSDGYLN